MTNDAMTKECPSSNVQWRPCCGSAERCSLERGFIGVLVWHRKLVIRIWSLVILLTLVIGHWSFPRRRFHEWKLDRGADIQNRRNHLINGAGLKFLDGGVFGRVVFKRVLNDQHDGFEQDTQRADYQQRGREPAVFSEQAIEQRLEDTGVDRQGWRRGGQG